MGLTAKELRALKCNLFATKDSLDESFKYAEMCIPENVTTMLLMIHTNTLLEHLAREEESV